MVLTNLPRGRVRACEAILGVGGGNYRASAEALGAEVMAILQLDPMIPVVVVSKAGAAGHAIGWIDYSQEHNLLWVVALDAGGEVWVVPNSDVRLQVNFSLGRTADGTLAGDRCPARASPRG